jgi:hypothetical protein
MQKKRYGIKCQYIVGKEMVQLDATDTKFIRVLYLNMFRASICHRQESNVLSYRIWRAAQLLPAVVE